ncbi:hypothetical protein [Flavobacterium sp.]|uniref:hypothetical protein n=1 Tax=Flavobacterium sp. TaxID=239 RepID=UPI003D13AF5C
MRKSILYILPFLCLLFSCKEQPKPKVKYDKPVTKIAIKQDTTRLEVADLPVQMGSVLVYPIGQLRVSDLRKGEFESEKTEGAVFNVSNVMDDELTGYMKNIKFQEIGKDSLHVLSDKELHIERMTYLKHKKIFVYVLADSDTNQDGKVDADDVKSLYISSELGKDFTKLSADMQEVLDWNYIENTGKIFFRTLDDRNKNGAFDKQDGIHYFYVNLMKEWKAQEVSVVK